MAIPLMEFLSGQSLGKYCSVLACEDVQYYQELHIK